MASLVEKYPLRFYDSNYFARMVFDGVYHALKRVLPDIHTGSRIMSYVATPLSEKALDIFVSSDDSYAEFQVSHPDIGEIAIEYYLGVVVPALEFTIGTSRDNLENALYTLLRPYISERHVNAILGTAPQDAVYVKLGFDIDARDGSLHDVTVEWVTGAAEKVRVNISQLLGHVDTRVLARNILEKFSEALQAAFHHVEKNAEKLIAWLNEAMLSSLKHAGVAASGPSRVEALARAARQKWEQLNPVDIVVSLASIDPDYTAVRVDKIQLVSAKRYTDQYGKPDMYTVMLTLPDPDTPNTLLTTIVEIGIRIPFVRFEVKKAGTRPFTDKLKPLKPAAKALKKHVERILSTLSNALNMNINRLSRPVTISIIERDAQNPELYVMLGNEYIVAGNASEKQLSQATIRKLESMLVELADNMLEIYSKLSKESKEEWRNVLPENTTPTRARPRKPAWFVLEEIYVGSGSREKIERLIEELAEWGHLYIEGEDIVIDEYAAEVLRSNGAIVITRKLDVRPRQAVHSLPPGAQ